MAIISIIFPVGRLTDFTILSLKSALNQNLKEIILIVVDNTGGKKIKELIKGFKDDRILYLKYDEKFGAAEARNFGLQHVKTEFLAILDSDDFYLPNHLKLATNTLIETNSDVYYCGYINQYASGFVFPRVPKKELRYFDLLTFNPIGHSTVVMKSYIKPKYENYEVRHDLLLWTSLFKKKFVFVNNQEINVIRNILLGSLSKNKSRLVLAHYNIYRNALGFSLFNSIVLVVIICARHSIQFLIKSFKLKLWALNFFLRN